MEIRPVTLEGSHVRLEPLAVRHLDGLVIAAAEWNITSEQMREGIEDALRDQAAGAALPFATVHVMSGRIVGSTRFREIVQADRRLEIGSTWVGVQWRRTRVNTEAKYLMLEYAFERLGFERVEFHVDTENESSRRSVLRLGATEEGILRSYAVTRGGDVRDIVSYSIVRREWPGLKAHLQELLARSYSGVRNQPHD